MLFLEHAFGKFRFDKLDNLQIMTALSSLGEDLDSQGTYHSKARKA